jgi:hypothetical protein
MAATLAKTNLLRERRRSCSPEPPTRAGRVSYREDRDPTKFVRRHHQPHSPRPVHNVPSSSDHVPGCSRPSSPYRYVRCCGASRSWLSGSSDCSHVVDELSVPVTWISVGKGCLWHERRLSWLRFCLFPRSHCMARGSQRRSVTQFGPRRPPTLAIRRDGAPLECRRHARSRFGLSRFSRAR